MFPFTLTHVDPELLDARIPRSVPRNHKSYVVRTNSNVKVGRSGKFEKEFQLAPPSVDCKRWVAPKLLLVAQIILSSAGSIFRD